MAMSKLLTFTACAALLLQATLSLGDCKSTFECAQQAVEAATDAKASLNFLLPAGAVVPFARNQCPPNWDEYPQAYGRFVRGMDKSIGSNQDPEWKKTSIGDTQRDILRTHVPHSADPQESISRNRDNMMYPDISMNMWVFSFV